MDIYRCNIVIRKLGGEVIVIVVEFLLLFYIYEIEE